MLRDRLRPLRHLPITLYLTGCFFFLVAYVASFWFGPISFTVEASTGRTTMPGGEKTYAFSSVDIEPDWCKFSAMDWAVWHIYPNRGPFLPPWLENYIRIEWFSDGSFYVSLLSPILAVVLALPPLGWFAANRRKRARHPRCTSCGYNLTGNITGRCPECGVEAAVS